MTTDPMEQAQRAFDTIRQKDGKGGEALVRLREALNALENQDNDVTTNYLSGRSLDFNSDALRRHLKGDPMRQDLFTHALNPLDYG